MNLRSMLERRAAEDRPIRVGIIGAGKFASMYLAQARRTPGVQIMGIADLALENAERRLAAIGWPDDAYAAGSWDEAAASGTTHLTEDVDALISEPRIDVVVEATGDPIAAIGHAGKAIDERKHVIMVTVEGDALCGPLLARRAEAAGVVYSLAYGDQPALICEQVDWARACGFEVMCAGRGVKYLPAYHRSTPETVWEIYYGRLDAAAAAAGGLNAKMFNSFIDGTKPAIESTAVANACALRPQVAGLKFPPCGADDLARVCRPVGDGGCLEHRGTVEVVSSLERDGRPVFRDMRWGVFVTFEAPDDYVARCFAEYGLKTDDSGRASALYREVHLIGLELGISVANVALRGEPTGRPVGWYGDAVAVAKRDLCSGATLDGEGGTTVWGRLMPAADSQAMGALPIGLAQDVKLMRPVAEDAVLTWGDVAIDQTDDAVRMRREMETAFALECPKAAE